MHCVLIFRRSFIHLADNSGLHETHTLFLLGGLIPHHFVDDLLLLNEESAHNLLADGLVAEHSAVGPEDLLVSQREP